MKLPAGIIVPSEKVKSFIVLRSIVTADSNVVKVYSSRKTVYVHATICVSRIVSLIKQIGRAHV